LRAAARKMQHAVERAAGEGVRNRTWEALDLDRAIAHHRHDRHVADGEIAGAVLAGEIEEWPQLFAPMRTQQIDKIVLVAVGGIDRAEACSPRSLGRVAADDAR